MITIPDPPSPANGQAEGERRRDAALAILSATRPAIIRRLQRAAVEIALDTGTVISDDVRAVVPIPPGIHPTVTGAAINGLAMLGILRGGDHIRSRRPVAHARHVRVWLLTNEAAALKWLAANPASAETAEEGHRD
ncbi:MAG: hypothetical protein EXS09_22600 [Gemmataceae bacterium]|nr:hypothetical protein [Gemmataceae bacterium]